MPAGVSFRGASLETDDFEGANMTEQRQHVRYQVEFPATFEGDHAGIGIVYNLGIGGCKVVTDLAVHNGSLLSVQLKIPQFAGNWTSSLGWNFLRCRRGSEPV